MPDFSNLLILMVVVWTAGKIFRYFKLPVVFGELLGGLIVGPALLGIVNPESETLKILAELGVFFLMLHAGLETDHKQLFKTSKQSFLIALSGMAVPFFGGYYVSTLFGQNLITSLFIGMGLSISAIPVAVRLLRDCGLNGTRLANLALGAAVIDDIMAIIIFSVIISLAETGSIALIPLAWLVIKILLFFGIVIIGGVKVSPYLNKVIYFGNKAFTLTLIIALVMGLIAEYIGLHIIVGAFLAGLFVREEVIDKHAFKKIEDRIYGLSYSFLGPIFFASVAFNIDFTAVTTVPLFFVVIIITAMAGKIIGGGGMAYLLKTKPMEALAIGLAMNNRCAVELIIASIGLQMGIIDQNIFSILVMMVLITTLTSILLMTPVANAIKRSRQI